MKNRKAIYKDYFAHNNAEATVSISDLRDKEFRDLKLSREESQALLNFDRYKLEELKKIKSDIEFNARYCQLQIMANVTDHREFLKEEYFFSELL